jgi:thiamine-phosphate pyrophosphorylase
MSRRDGLRILDANLNRCREGLRVLEDIARFSRNSADLAARCKQARHALAEAVAGVPPADLLAARDTPGDVGTVISTDAEYRRSGLASVALAAAKRAQEAARSIEESLKLVLPSTGDPAGSPAARVEQVRYALYELERRLIAELPAPAPQWRLCVLVTQSLCRLPWEEVVRRAIAGGADCIQLREKSLPDGELFRRASKARALCAGVSLVINDRVDVALAAGADGVHVGQEDLSVAAVRAAAGTRPLLVGVSTHDPAELEAMILAGADNVGVGAMFATSTKVREVSGPAYLSHAVARLARVPAGPLPHLAIGGITPENVGLLAGCGCQGVAVSGVVCQATEPEEVCRRLLAGLAVAPPAMADR